MMTTHYSFKKKEKENNHMDVVILIIHG